MEERKRNIQRNVRIRGANLKPIKVKYQKRVPQEQMIKPRVKKNTLKIRVQRFMRNSLGCGKPGSYPSIP